MDRNLLSNLIIAGIVNAIVIWLISQYSEKLAKLYTVLVLLVALLSYRNEFFNGINVGLSAIRLADNK